MEPLEAELDRARDLDVAELADAIESIGFECTRCGGCCTGYAPDEPGGAPADEDESEVDSKADGDRDRDDREPHTATVFPDEVREVADAAVDGAYDWRDVARPMPYGLAAGEDGDPAGETFEWALATDDCGDCTFYEESDGRGACTVHDSRPLICRTYPFSVALGGTSQPMGEAVDGEGIVRAHECEGLGRDIAREDAESLAAALKERAIRELEEAIAVRDGYDPTAAERADGDVVVFDSEGPKHADGTPIGGE
ncbi:YkgJ family cysteine cluster protein [Halorubrum halodurans]|uniref:Zinc/iron-chelating domain-containing protein n=1 Tax=Halorubrum halodurans TaxID=1383851 RepID=A0A256IEB7_9EURY|nr:YkgJ family cysteine cluster protein [Halorubrum halodurans]OYR54666.1 zinc/iron-chelating domain-containing protein [Halorubrum halodurans]